MIGQEKKRLLSFSSCGYCSNLELSVTLIHLLCLKKFKNNLKTINGAMNHFPSSTIPVRYIAIAYSYIWKEKERTNPSQ